MTKTVLPALSIKLFFIFLGLYLFPVSLTAQQETNEDSIISSSLNQDVDANLAYFTNTVLINQFGEEIKFYEDLLKDKIVVINSFFSESTGACLVMHKSIQQIQKHFKDRIGQDIILISITVDPKVDRPEILMEYAKRFEANRGWYFLTGNPENVEFILKKLGKYVYSREAHDTIFLIGNIPTGLWKKEFGLRPIEEIIKLVESVVNDTE